MTAARVIAWSALALLGRIFWNYLPMAIEAALDGSITWRDVRPCLAYFIRADVGEVRLLDGWETIPYKLRDQ